MRIDQLSVLDAIGSLKGAAEGLSRAEAERRLREYGRNAVEQVARANGGERLVFEWNIA